MKIVSSRVLGVQPVYDLSVEHDDHSFIHESGVIAHNCAYVIANRPIEEFIPLTKISDVRCTAYTAPSVEAVGGLKMDFLVINSLNDISNAIKLVQSRNGGEFKETYLDGKRVPAHRLVPLGDQVYDIWDLPEDQSVFADIATGRTETVFQFNTPGAIQWMEHFAYRKVDGNYALDSIEAMSAFTALDRPGPLNKTVSNPDNLKDSHNMLVEYARRARGATGSADVLKVFDDIMPETYGVMVYQEQLQRAYQTLAGCSGPEAEEFRTLVAKKKMEKVQKLYTPFITSAAKRIGEDNAKAAWEFFITWGQYGFNKSHAVCYSVIGYACAWMKYHYPLEWWTAVLRNAEKNEISEKFWRFCGNVIDLPDVKLSGHSFEIQGGRIRAPVSLLQRVGDSASKQLAKYAPYTDILDFCTKIEQHRQATGHWEKKPKKEKIKESRRKDPETNKWVYDERVVEVDHFKKGYNALNRGVVTTLIVSGAMDSLFPPGMHLGEQFVEYERVLAIASGAKKPKKVDPTTWDIGPIERYQTRKGILAAYGTDLIKLVHDTQSCAYLTVDDLGRPWYTWVPFHSDRSLELPVSTAVELERAQVMALADGNSIQVAVMAYIEDVRIFRYGEEKREACELLLDVEGARFKFVKWAGKAIDLPDSFKVPLKGAVAAVVLNKYKSDRPFAIEDAIIIKPPLSKKAETEQEEEDADE